MSETVPTAEISLTLRIEQRHIPELVGMLAHMAVGQVEVGRLPEQLDTGFAAEIDRAELQHHVTLRAARGYYDEFFKDDTPSSLATSAFQEIGRSISDEGKEVDENGRVVSVSRGHWDAAVGRILAVKQEGPITWGPDSKKKRFVYSFQSWLPQPQDSPDDRA